MIFESCFIPFLSPGVGTQASSLDSKHLSLLRQPAGSVCSYMGAVSSSHLEAYLVAFLHGSRPRILVSLQFCLLSFKRVFEHSFGGRNV